MSADVLRHRTADPQCQDDEHLETWHRRLARALGSRSSCLNHAGSGKRNHDAHSCREPKRNSRKTEVNPRKTEVKVSRMTFLVVATESGLPLATSAPNAKLHSPKADHVKDHCEPVTGVRGPVGSRLSARMDSETCARSFRLNRIASRRRCAASASWCPSTRAMAFLCTLAIHSPTRTTHQPLAARVRGSHYFFFDLSVDVPPEVTASPVVGFA